MALHNYFKNTKLSRNIPVNKQLNIDRVYNVQ